MRKVLVIGLAVLALAASASAQPFRVRSLTAASAACPDAGCEVQDVQGFGTVGLQIAGTFTATLQIEGSIDNTNYVSIACLPNGGSATVTSATAPGVWTCPTAGLRFLRVRVSAFTSGTATVTMQAVILVARSLFPLSAPSLTGQWTVNGSLCAAGQVVQGGSPTTCTATPTLTSLTINSSVLVGGVSANQLEVRNGSNTQDFFVYGNYVDSANYNRFRIHSGTISGNTNAIGLWNESAGSVGNGYMFLEAAGNRIYFGSTSTQNAYLDASGYDCASNGGCSIGSLGSMGDLYMHGGNKWRPDADSTTALNIANATGTAQVVFDTTNARVHFGSASAPGPYTVDVAGTVNISNTLLGYDGRVTAGIGLPAIFGLASITGTQTANATILTFSPLGSVGQYVCSETITTTSATNTGTVQATIDYVDSQGTTHTGDIMFLYGANAAPAATQTGASKEWRSLPWRLTVNSSNTNIVLKVVVTGSVSYTASAHCEQLSYT